LVGHKTPNPTIDDKAAVITPAVYKVDGYRSGGPSSAAASFLALGAASSMGGFGFGQSISPLSVTMAPRATSSPKLVVVAPSLTKIYCMNFEILFAYSDDD
jgi:hypothetical protein